MIAKVYSAIPDGYDGHVVEVESDATKSLPCFNIVGMANKTISEARERVRSAITNSGLIFPPKKITVNLAPAELSKNGSGLDLPIALSVLVLAKHLQQSDLKGKLFVGELSLDGFIKPVRGIINIVESALTAGFSAVYLPVDNLADAALLSHLHPNLKLIGVQTLAETISKLRGYDCPVGVVNFTKTDKTPAATPICRVSQSSSSPTPPSSGPYLDQVQGQTFAKRALTIALAGRHNILLFGPPGAGKTLLARVASNLLPSPSLSEQIEIAKLHSLAGSRVELTARPFRSPHHSSSVAALIGGGPTAQPGEISLAHRGVLFLDELPEYSKSALEALRQPLEDKTVTISRANFRHTYPADFMLIATMNPCPCGHLGSPDHPCTCSMNQILAYQKRISGPILDRIDLIIRVNPVLASDLLSEPAPNASHSEHNVVKNTITDCHKLQFARYGQNGFYNSLLTPATIREQIPLTPESKRLIIRATKQLHLSARSFYKVLKVARTIADLDHKTEVTTEHISEALSYRDQIAYTSA